MRRASLWLDRLVAKRRAARAPSFKRKSAKQMSEREAIGCVFSHPFNATCSFACWSNNPHCTHVTEDSSTLALIAAGHTCMQLLGLAAVDVRERRHVAHFVNLCKAPHAAADRGARMERGSEKASVTALTTCTLIGLGYLCAIVHLKFVCESAVPWTAHAFSLARGGLVSAWPMHK